MDNLFRIKTDRTYLSWNELSPSEADTGSTRPDGRLAISLSNPISKNITIWRRGFSDDIANNATVEVGPRLYEKLPYNLFLQSTDQKRVELRHRDPVLLQALDSPDSGIVQGMINFGHQVGRSRFSVYVEGNAEYDFEVEVFPAWLDYVADYNALLADTQNILTGLGLEYLRSTFQFGFATDSESPSSLEWILSLRHMVEDLERGLRYVKQHPHHNLVPEDVLTRVEKLRRPDARILKMIAQGKGQGPKVRTASGLVLPSRLPQRRSQVTWDTPEHRWFAFQLTRIRESLAEIRLVESKRSTQSGPRQLRTIEEIADLENRIAALETLEPIAQATGLPPPGFTSLTLQTRPGYREAYQTCLKLLQGLRVDGGPVGLSVKDTDCLYEYWCYLALVRLVAKITGEQVPVRELFPVEQNGLHVRLNRGTSQTVKFSHDDRTLEVTYNPRYKDGTLILSQKPDVVLTLRDPHWPTLRLVFDTKYRINPKPDYVEQCGSPGPVLESIAVLHRYRDAILEQTGFQGSRSETLKRAVMEGVALFPYADLKDQFRNSQLWSSLTDSGIGAVPFLPSETRYLEEWLNFILKRGGWSTAESTIPYPSHAELRAWQEAEKVPVLIAVLRQNATEHLEWIKEKRRYYIPFDQAQPRQLVARWIAIYLPASVRRPETITHLAEIQNFELTKRSEIETPWLPEGSADDMQVVYQLGEVRELERPIENRGPRELSERFSQNCWTSRLGILKATELREILLETSAEWRLCEQLRIAGVDFTLKPGAARLEDQNDPGGRTWFVRKHLRVQYRGAAGFLLRRQGVRDEYRSNLAEVVERMISQT